MADKETAELSIKTLIEAYTKTKSLEDLNKLLEAIKQSFIDTSKDGTQALESLVAPTESTIKVVKVLNSTVKNLSKTLKSLETAATGLKALENETFFKGWKKKQTFGDDAYISALGLETLGRKRNTIRVNSPIGMLKDLINTQDYNIPTKRATVNQIRQSIREYVDKVLYETFEGQESLKYDVSRTKEKIIDKSTTQAIKSGTGLSSEAIEDAKKAARYSDSLAVVQLRLMANYKAINLVTSGFKYLLNYTVQYDKELHQLQSIAAISNVGMRDLKNTIDEVATSTKFTSLEVAKAGTVLAQAGLSAKQIADTLPAIAKLATATGTDLATSTDVITSTMNIYNLQTSEAVQVTNALTTAMNESKADIAGFQTAIQYAGNFAAQLGMTYDETASAIAAATQAGIRSKSMLGTGLRAVMTEFLKPTKKLVAELNKVGLTVDDIDIKVKGFNNVLKTLKQAGFGATEAFRGMERRGAAFLVSLINQTEFIDDMRMKMMGSTAAIKANDKQMEALANQMDNFKSVMGTVASNGLQPFITMLSKVLSVVNSFFSSKVPGGITSIIFGTLGAAGTMASLAMLLSTLKAIWNVLKNIKTIAGVVLLNKDIGNLSGWVATVAKWMKTGPIIAWSSVIAGLASGVYMLAEKFGLLDTALEKAQGNLEKSKGEVDEVSQSMSTAEGLLQRLYDSREKLQDQTERDIFFQEALSKFPKLIDLVDKTKLSFDELVEAIKNLNLLQLEEKIIKLKVQTEDEKDVEKAKAKDVGAQLFKITESASPDTIKMINALKLENPHNVRLATSFGNLSNLVAFLKNKDIIDEGQVKELLDFTGRDNLRRKKGLQLEDAINKYIDTLLENDKAMSEITAELRVRALEWTQKSKNSAFSELVESILEKRSSERELSQGQRQFAVKTAEKENEQAYDDLTQSIKNATESLDNYDQELKTLGVAKNIDAIGKAYENLLVELSDLTKLKSKSFKEYSDEEAARYIGADSVADFEKALKTYINYLPAEEKKDKSNEELREMFLEDSSKRNDLIDQINRTLKALRHTLEKSAAGEEYITRNDVVAFYEKIEKNMGKTTRYSGKLGKERRDQDIADIKNYAKLAIDNIVKTKLTENAPQFNITFIGTDGKVVSSDNLKGQIEESFKSAGKELSGEDYNKAVANFEGVREQVESWVNLMNKITPSSGAGAGKQFDAATERMNYFFSSLQADIKKIETAYAEAEHALDSLVAKQQGVVTGSERIYGSSSVIAQAEQINLKNLQKSLLSARTENMQKELDELEKKQALLRSNEKFKVDDLKYKEYEEKFLTSARSGDSKTARLYQVKLNNMSSVYKQMASEDKSLTDKINKLKDSIDANTIALEMEKELANKSASQQIGLGVRSAMTTYTDSVNQQGLNTIAGAAGYLTSNVISSLDSGFTSLFQNIVSGSKKASEAFKDFGRQILETIRDIAIQMAVKQGLSALFSAFIPDTGINGLKVGETSGNMTRLKSVGGAVTGPVKNRDSVNMKLMPGEYVLKKSAVDVIGRDYLDSLNDNASAVLNASAESVGDAKTDTESNTNTGAGGTVNVYVVGQEQQQAMTPSDVLVTITQDMLTGGQTKRLVKSIAMGAL